MKPQVETLKVTRKIIRRKYPYMRTPKAYCTYIVENENHKHRLRTYEGTELFELLSSTTISKDPKYFWSVFVDGTYINNKLFSITNPRKTC